MSSGPTVKLRCAAGCGFIIWAPCIDAALQRDLLAWNCFMVQRITLCFALPVPLCCMCWKGPIWKSIQWLDELGMKAIETVGLLVVGGQQLQARCVHWHVHSASFVTHASFS